MAQRGERELAAAGGPGMLAANGKRVESVWDFPRPPRVEAVSWRIRVIHRGVVIVDAPSAMRLLETSQAPAYYVDQQHVRIDRLRPSQRRTFCEWKGTARFADLTVDGETTPDACWTYPEPSSRYATIAGMWAFYAQVVDECWVDDERVDSNDGNFYGGWITGNVTGPFKGGPATSSW